MKWLLALTSAAAALALGAAGAAQASVIYTNGPINGSKSAFTIDYASAVEDSFTVTSTTTITGVQFGAWVWAGDQPTSVDWGIESSPTFVVQGTASLSSTLVAGGIWGGAYDVYQSTFSIPSMTLTPGTYWLALQNGGTAKGQPLLWDVNDGPSAAVQNLDGAIGSESFSLLGGVPEPSTWAMLILGVAMVGFAVRRQREGLTVAA
jgi:hypothetical protein